MCRVFLLTKASYETSFRDITVKDKQWQLNSMQRKGRSIQLINKSVVKNLSQSKEVDSDANHPKLNDALWLVAINKQRTGCGEIEA